MRIKKGDTVQVISGEDKGVTGTVRRVYIGRQRPHRGGRTDTPRLALDPSRDKVLVSGVNLVKKHQRRTGEPGSQGGIIEREAPIHVSKVALVCPQCQKASRVGYQILDTGRKVRVCKRCGQVID